MDVSSVARDISIKGVPLLMAIILHEVAHGWVAEKFGDPTARRAGRITLNPFSHIDPIGTVLLPIMQIALFGRFIIGWAKPVPVNFAALRNPKKDMVWVALAGPGTNFTLALFSALLLRIAVIVEPSAQMLANIEADPALLRSIGVGVSLLVPIVLMLNASVWINCALMVINLIPIPPLDGGRVMVGLLPRNAAYTYSKIERYGIFILFALLFFSRTTQGILWVLIGTLVSLFNFVAFH